ncbi:MAG: hypothetical protein ABR587_14200 [Candidatus Binatia bacterium]
MEADRDRAMSPTRHRRRTAPPAVVSVLAVAMAATFSACTAQTRVVGGGAGPVLGAPIKIAPGNVSASFSVVGDSAQILRESAGDSLKEAGMTCPGPSAGCAVVDLHARILQAASSFAGAAPPVRVVELVATYHGPGAQRSTLSYQRTVAATGNLSTATWMRISDALMNDLAADFAFRSQRAGIVIRLPSWATAQTTLDRTSAPRAFHVAITGDGRSDNDSIGVVGTREVRLARRATDYVTEMLTDELRGAGHTIVPARDGRLVGSQLEKFWISSAKASGGWQTTAEIDLALEVAPPTGIKRKKAEHHTCTATERSSSAPGEPDLARLLQKCLSDLARSMRTDSAWSLGLGAPKPES